MEVKLRKGQKVIRLADKELIKVYQNDGYVIVDKKGLNAAQKANKPAAPNTPAKTFKQKNAGEQIAAVEACNTIEELEALKGQEPKKTALAAIDVKLAELNKAKLEEVKAKAVEAGVEVVEEDTIETLEAKIAEKEGQGQGE